LEYKGEGTDPSTTGCAQLLCKKLFPKVKVILGVLQVLCVLSYLLIFLFFIFVLKLKNKKKGVINQSLKTFSI
jgi:hypothetical protein